MQLVHANEHLANVKPRDLLLENSRVVEKGAEVATRNVLHREIDMLWILECVQQSDEPWGFGRSQDITFDQNMADLL